MFKNGIKNFFINLKHFFVPLGALFLGLVIGLSVFIPYLYHAVSTAVGEVNELLQEMRIDFEAMWSSVVNSVTSIDWENPEKALQIVFAKNWFVDTLSAAVNAAIGESMQLVGENLPQILDNASQTILLGITFLVLFTAFGVLGGYYMTAFYVRRTIARRAFWKLFSAFFVDSLLDIALVAMCVWLATLWTYSVIFTLIAVAIITAYKSLFQAYLMQGLGKVKIGKIVNFKNALQYLLCCFTIWIIVVVLVVLANVVNVVLAVLVGVALVEIALAVNNLNAEAYVKDCVGE